MGNWDTKEFYYYIPKVIFVTVVLTAALFGLGFAVFFANDQVSRVVVVTLFIMLLLVFYFLIVDALLPLLQKKAVLIIDENGITDVISWGLIRWSNIRALNATEVGTMSRVSYQFTELRILLTDFEQYDCYMRSRWIRFKVKLIRLYRGGAADIIIDIDTLDGNVENIFQEINKYYKRFKDNGQTHIH